MKVSFGEKVKILLNRRGYTITELAALTGQSRQNLSNKFNRDNFSEEDIKKLAEALGCDYEITLTMKNTGEKI